MTWAMRLVAVSPEQLGQDSKLDFYEDFGSFVFPWLLYFLWGFCDAFVQCWSYWLMGQLSDDPKTLSRYAGFYKVRAVRVRCCYAARRWLNASCIRVSR